MLGRELAHQRGDVGRGVAAPTVRAGGGRAGSGRADCGAGAAAAAAGCGRAVSCWAEVSSARVPGRAAAPPAGTARLPARARRLVLEARPAGSRSGPGLRPARRCLLRAGADPPPEPPMTASSAPTGTVSSSWTRILVRVPATGEGISVSTLSVETSSSGSSTSTSSPSALSQRVTVPSVTDSPSAGIVTVWSPPAGAVGGAGRRRLLGLRRPRARSSRAAAPARLLGCLGAGAAARLGRRLLGCGGRLGCRRLAAGAARRSRRR